MKQHLEEHLALNAKYGFAPVIPGRAKILEGWWQVERGESELGIAMIGGIEFNSASNNAANAAFYSSLLTRAYARAGRLNDGLRVFDQAIARVEQSGERFFEAELFRLKGELLHSSNADAPSVGTCLRKAIEVARSQSAKSVSCAPPRASRGCSRSRVIATKPAQCSPTSTAGSPRASTLPI